MKHIRGNKLISGFIGITVLLTALWFVHSYIEEASADAWLTADAHVIDSYINGCGYCNPPKAPTSMQILVHGGGNFDGATNFQWDCDNDGKYEGSGSGAKARAFNPGDGTVMIEWGNGWGLGSHSWNVYGGGESEYWYELTASCSYQTGGGKTVRVKAERGGMVATGSTGFSIQELTFNFRMGFPANGSYHPPVDDPRGVKDSGTAAPSNVDLGIGMREDGARYQNDDGAWDFDSRGFTYAADCNGDGKFDERGGSANNSSFYIYPGYPPKWTNATLAQSVCSFVKPGTYRINLNVKDPAGKEHTLSQDVYLRSNEPFVINVYPTGEAAGATSYALSGGQNVKLSVKITGLTPVNTGSYSTTIDCGNGQTVSGPGGNGRNYPEGTLTGDNLGPCNYNQPGVYTVVAKFQEYKPASEIFTAKSGEGKAKIIITGCGTEKVCTVVSPFSLEWDVAKATTCSITGLTDRFSAAGLASSGTKAVPKVAIGLYDYLLSCSGPGSPTPTEQIIKVNVVGSL
ncbi:MAG: hypothetical protein HYR95_01985 [Candidatus Colwellbacteria bacterium]|nr:hypothetical protein [Candidatus Colwellbacteria bacterium]